MAVKTKSREAGSFAVSAARREAFRILLEVESGQGHADDLLRGAKVSALAPADRNLATTLVLGTLRWQIRLDAQIQPLLTRPKARLDAEIRIALRLGVFQLLYLDRIPAHAAIGESVALAKSAGHTFAAGMVNAVLRKDGLRLKLPRRRRTLYGWWSVGRRLMARTGRVRLRGMGRCSRFWRCG